jgi:hypothetical protein
MPDERLEKISFFEGVFIGLYGGWFISFVDKLSFDKSAWILGIWYQPFCVLVTLVGISLLFIYVLFAPRILREKRSFMFIVSLSPVVGMWGALTIEGFIGFKLLIFGFMGYFFYLIIFLCELVKVRYTSKIS